MASLYKEVLSIENIMVYCERSGKSTSDMNCIHACVDAVK